MTFLTSYSGPCTSIERQTFAQLLHFFGQDSVSDSRDETTGATGTTEVAPKFSDTFTLFQPDEVDSAQHRRGRTKNLPMDTSLDLQVNLCQKLFFLQNMGRTWREHVLYKNCSDCHKQLLYTTCSFQV